MTEEQTLLWTPPAHRETAIDRFRERVNSRFNVRLENYEQLRRWSVDYYGDFWEQFFDFSAIVHSQKYSSVVDKSKGIADKPEWFHGCRLNYAENLLCCTDDTKVAIVAAGEGRDTQHVTFGDLRKRVALLASALRAVGVSCGDNVVGYVPNCSLAVEAMLATSSLGAVWSSTSPDFGVTGVLDRFSQIQPTVLFSVDAVIYNGKTHDHISKLRGVVEGLPCLKKVVIMPYTSSKESLDVSSIPYSIFLDDFLRLAEQESELRFEQVPFNHPLFIMYSSGTTGKPKCMVHSVGGTLIQHLKEHILHGNMTSSDVITFYTTTGWMMWNWLVTALAVGSAVVLYDGSPLVPSVSILWDLVDKEKITILGTGAKWLAALEDRNVRPVTTHRLTSLHTILSTGSPLRPRSFDYVYRDIKADVLLGSITGGTDLISCFAGQNPTLPVYRGEIQARNLGMAVECWDENGRAVEGVSGELVCLHPFPSMPTCFWNDGDGTKYNRAYFSRFPGVWHHGDYCTINPRTGGIIMQGRSDGTLNPSGVRFGSADIYNIVEAFAEVDDSLCVGQVHDCDERVILFLKMAPLFSFSQELCNRIRSSIRSQLSARHVPAVILETKDIPYTVSGKKVEVAVKKIISGLASTVEEGALRNPESLALYSDLEALRV